MGSQTALMRRVAMAELKAASGEGIVRTSSPWCAIGQAKAALAADYAAQLSHSVGKVVFFAKHLDVMDKAEQVLARGGLRTISIRGTRRPSSARTVDAFQKDPEVSVAVCSLLAAGVGVNLHASSNVVLAEFRGPRPRAAGDRPGPPDRAGRAGHGGGSSPPAQWTRGSPS